MIPPGFISLATAYARMAASDERDASGRLRYFLRTGGLQASSVNRDGTLNPLHEEFWGELSKAQVDEIFEISQMTGTNAPSTFVVSESDVTALQAPTGAVDGIPLGTMGNEVKSGRPLKFDWEAIWAGIALTLLDYGRPSSQDEMIKKVSEWYEADFGPDTAPSRSSLQLRVGRLLALLEGKPPSIVFRKDNKLPQ